MVRLAQLNVDGTVISSSTPTYDVSNFGRASIQVIAVSGSFSGGIVTIQKSVDGTNWEAFSPALTASSVTILENIDVGGINAIRGIVTTTQGGALVIGLIPEVDTTLIPEASLVTDADAIHDNVDGEIDAIALKGSPVSGDITVIEDSAASWAKKKITIGSIPLEVASTVRQAIYNNSGSTLNVGEVVYLTGWNAGTSEPTVALADGDDPAKMPALGMVYTSIANLSSGTITTFGVVAGVNTSTDAEGDPVYVSTTAGAWTTTRPTVDDIQKIGVVSQANAVGKILIVGAGRANDVPIAPSFTDFTNANHDHADAAGGGTVDHTDLTTIGTNTHAQIDTHLALTNEHVDWAASAAGTIHTDNYIEGGDGTDGTAIHDNVASEISAVTNKATPVSGDFLLIEDSAAANVKKHITVGSLPSGGGETNTGSNQGTDGVGVFDTKSVADLQFRHVAPGSTKVTTTLNVKDIDVDVVEANLVHDHDGVTGGGTIDHVDLANKGTNTHAQIDTHIGVAVVDSDFGTAGYCKTDGAGAYSVQSAPIPTTETAAKCTDATADNTSANETTHADVVQDGDFSSDGYLQRSGGSGSYAVQATPIPTTDTAAKCTDATADNTAANETSHTGVLTTTSTDTVTNKDLTAETNKLRYSKSITVEDPADSDLLAMFMNERAITVLGVSFASLAGTSVLFGIDFNTTIATGGTTVHTDTCASTTPEWDVTPSGDATIPTDQIVLLRISTVTGTVTDFTVTIYYDED